MRILLLDIETAPNLVYSWGLFNQNLSIENVVRASHVLCWGAKWLDEPKKLFDSCQDGNRERMIRGVHALMGEADAIVHYNGNAFDIPKLNQEIQLFGLTPPSPSKQIDMYRVVKKKFDLPSSKMEFVARYFGYGHKVKHPGFSLWIGCMNGDPKSWKLMKKYNLGDIDLLEQVYLGLRPWIDNHPNYSLYEGDGPLSCPNCGSKNVQRRGTEKSKTRTYARFQCRDCGKWSRAARCVPSLPGSSLLTD